MTPRSGDRPLRVLRVGLYLLLAALLAVAVGRAVDGDAANAPAVVAVAVLLLAVALAGPLLRRVRRSRDAATVWLAVLTVLWLVLLTLTADGVWLAFPLFFLQLHLLPRRWGLVAVAVTTVVAVVGFALHQQSFVVAAAIGPVIGAVVAVAVVRGYQALYRESEERRRLLEQLAATRDELATVSHAAGVAAERERLAREIHDTLAQGLSSIQLLLRAVERALPDQPENATAIEHVRQARQAAQDNLAEARRFVRALTPPDLEQGSLPAAIQRVCDTVAQRSGLTIDVRLSGTPTVVDTPYEVALLRIVQSALANATQHAHAQRVAVTLSYMDPGIALDIVDDGDGFDPAAPVAGPTDGGFGLAAMRARVADLGGRLSVESAPGQGTALAVSFLPPPLPVETDRPTPETEAPPA